MRRQRIDVQKIVRGIKEQIFREKKPLQKHFTDDQILENEIEGGLITSYEYSDPTIFLPINPLFRLLKKTLLFLMRVYIKAQIVFNKNVFYVMNRLFIQNLNLKKRVDELEKAINELKKTGLNNK